MLLDARFRGHDGGETTGAVCKLLEQDTKDSFPVTVRSFIASMKASSLTVQSPSAAGVSSFNGFCSAIAGLAFAGSCILWIATRWGIGLYPDSIVYVGAARSIVAGDGLRFLDDVGTFAPVVQYPPLYSALVAAFGVIGLDPLEGARWVSILCYGANAMLAAYIAFSVTSSKGASLLVAFLALSGFPMVYIHSQALTEPMFIFLIFLALVFLARYLSGSHPWTLYGCALCVGVSCLARYVGVAFIMTGAMALLCLSQGDWKKRIADMIKFGVVSSLPLGVWVIRNFLLAGDPVNRTFSIHPPALKDFLQVLDTIGYWLIPIAVVDGAPWISRPIVGVVFLALCWLARKTDLFRLKVPQLLAFCVLGYGLFLLISWSVNDQPLYLDTRTMALPYLALMILSVCALTDRLRAANAAGKSWRCFAINCLLIVVLALHTINGAIWLRYSYLNGIGFATERWRSSELLKFVRDAAAPLVVFSNAPDFIYTLTGKRANMIPHKIEPNSRAPNKQYGADIAAMQDQLKKRNAVLIYFNDEDRLWYLPSIQELQSILPLQAVKAAKDGTIYGLRTVATVAER